MGNSMDDNRAYMIAYLVHYGWRFGDVWTSDKTEGFYDLTAAYNKAVQMNKDEAYDAQDTDTVPSPPNPEIGLMDVLNELCEAYDLAYDATVHRLIMKIARSINYSGTKFLAKDEDYE